MSCPRSWLKQIHRLGLLTWLQRIFIWVQKFTRRLYRQSWLQSWIRLGYGAKGSVYFIIGVIAARSLLIGRSVSGTDGALVEILIKPFGRIFLGILCLTLLGYVLWRFIQAVLDPEHEAELSPQRVVQRLGYAMSAASYGGVAYSAFELATGTDEVQEGDDAIEDLVTTLFDIPFGEWLIILGALGVMAVGLSYIYGAISGSYLSEFHNSADQTVAIWAKRIGQIGIAARGSAFLLIGVLIANSAISHDEDSAGGLSNALQYLRSHSLGSVGLGIIALGFMAYGLYMYFAAGYRQFSQVSKLSTK
ncbi:MAG: DUF1206 domain-containing protein [Leptolyngbyaceae cyanobacterium SM1_1_3]|nr:DUF1206 domain-containing protein [Leptolyngbyaceae cyanobacterium SM1_1_3]NJM85367.1 DUF1206 domain-containing protein [Leptolyngbyaceae cyanobacterium RM2_2_21]NJN02685.1 DUF1206 domain-containing protein [Leptolyngbyaceae cyanobacterium RM1_1_2]NJO11862.1 DUF1206 domain-containing protein [Leptolyngbyaceae cyanobacterium SL_1_1]